MLVERRMPPSIFGSVLGDVLTSPETMVSATLKDTNSKLVRSKLSAFTKWIPNNTQ